MESIAVLIAELEKVNAEIEEISKPKHIEKRVNEIYGDTNFTELIETALKAMF